MNLLDHLLPHRDPVTHECRHGGCTTDVGPNGLVCKRHRFAERYAARNANARNYTPRKDRA